MRFLICALLAGAVFAQSPRYGCEPAPDVTNALQRVDDLRSEVPSDRYIEQASQVLRQVIAKHPEDIFSNLRYLELFRSKGHDDVQMNYRSLMAAHPGDLRYELFYAASLVGTNTPDALKRLTALASQPDFPYPHLVLADIYSYSKFNDRSALVDSAIQFVTACPSYLPGYKWFQMFGDGERMRAITAKLREVLTGRTDRDALDAYRIVHMMEFRTTPPAQHAELRTRIQQDPPLPEPKPGPPKLPLYDISNEWYRSRPSHAATVEKAKQWIAKWPDEPLPYAALFDASSEIPETSEADLVAAGDRLIAINRKRPGVYLSTPAIIRVAQAYVKRGLKLDLIPEMVATGLREAEARPRFPESDLFDDRNYRMNEQFRHEARIEARGVEFELALRQDDEPKALQALRLMRQELDELTAIAVVRGLAEYREANYWRLMAKLAAASRRPEDEARYRELVEQRRKPRIADQTAEWSSVDKPLSKFRVDDVSGKTWSNTDLAGKVAVLNLWATWCQPCIQELPHFQKLAERFRNNTNVVFLSLDVDSNPAVVEPFLKGRGFTLPVLFAHEFINQLDSEMAIPRTWLVDRTGVLRYEQLGFGEPDAWIAIAAAKIDELTK